MLNKIIFTITIISCFCLPSEITIAQSNEQLVQEGITYYHHGNYEKAIELFNKALKNIASTQKVIELANVSVRSDISVSKESDVRLSNERLMGVSNVQFVGVSKREFTRVSPKNHVTNPLSFHGSIAGKIYIYRGRAYLKLGMTSKAFSDFDNALYLNPLYSEAFFRRSIRYQDPEIDDICGDLKKAMQMGYNSGKMFYYKLCNYR
ncbi:MAG: tetratricopeptide repeat protein [Ignavibacteria bacterium]|nr:tetratricopeptide repeat protein [Ignavibacteria bacterium]